MAPVDRRQSTREEVANAVSHGVGCGLSIAALPILVVAAAREGSVYDIVGAALFGASMILLYLASTLYHALPQGPAKDWMQRLDHTGIYVLIAGSYTPFSLGVLRGGWGWSLFGVIWGWPLVGGTLKLLDRLKSRSISTALYLAMGWLILIASIPLAQRMPLPGLAWLAAGGLSYSIGAAIFAVDSRFPYAHSLWHLFVIGGTFCHFHAALNYAY